MKDLEMLHGALNLVKVNAGLKPEEKALIVCDTENIDIAKVLAYAVKSVGAEYSICIMEPRSTHGEDPTEAISKAMLGADVIFAPTKFSLSHSMARIHANENGARFISMPDYTRDMMKGGGLDADFLEIYKKVQKLKDILTNADKIHITTKAGTDIHIHAEGRIGNEVSGVCRTSGTWGSPPNIEVNVSPIEHLTQGKVVVDGSIPMPEIGVVTQPVVLTIKDGCITEFEGGKEAEIFRQLLKIDENPNNKVLAEFGIGMNDKATLKGSMLEDEGAYGTCHFGFGHNADQGGVNEASVHIDCVYQAATIDIDGRIVIKDGELQEI
ncbi:MAG: aminopeptidase [Candidatus Alectryocaccobium sp.]|jgi:2,5-dihydroxypyridine 5,6-dioxygenase|nr:aminopeptidase [Lachnospiraceae bacterium]MDY6221862.1 aminopeptidase [Candidatus Alectryocaccobium sp.]